MEGRLTGLDALRGIAALCVVLYHAAVFATGEPSPGKAYLAVDFFFVLSGYVMAGAYEDKLAAGMGGTRFLIARIRRIVPTMAFGGLLGLPLLYVTMPEHFITFAALNLLMLPVLFVGNIPFLLNGPAWSTFFELTANVLHAFCLHRVRTHILIVTVVGLGGVLVTIGWRWGINVGAMTDTFTAGFPRVLFSYIMGIVLWRKCGNRLPALLQGWLTLAAMPAFFMAVWYFEVQTGLVDLLFIFALSPALIAGGASLDAGKIGSTVGALSFPLYAVHSPIIETLRAIGLPVSVQIASAIGVAAAIVIIPQVIGMITRRLPRYSQT